MSRRIAASLGALMLLLPAAAHACAVCGGFADRNRQAFFNMTILLSLLPLALIIGGIWWVRTHLLRHETFEVTDSTLLQEPEPSEASDGESGFDFPNSNPAPQL